MVRYNNRENLVISALLAEGYTRSFNFSTDETLFYKLKGHFPAVDPEVIRHMLIKYERVYCLIRIICTACRIWNGTFSNSSQSSVQIIQ